MYINCQYNYNNRNHCMYVLYITHVQTSNTIEIVIIIVILIKGMYVLVKINFLECFTISHAQFIASYYYVVISLKSM